METPRGLHIPRGGTAGFAQALWRNQGCCWQKKELVYGLVAQTKRILHVSGHKINWGPRLGGRQRGRRGSFVGFGKRQPLHSPLCRCRLSLCFFPFSLQQVARHKPPWHSGPSHTPSHGPSPSAHHNPSQSSPEPSSTVAPQPFVPFYPLGHNSSTTCPSLPPSCP